MGTSIPKNGLPLRSQWTAENYENQTGGSGVFTIGLRSKTPDTSEGTTP